MANLHKIIVLLYHCHELVNLVANKSYESVAEFKYSKLTVILYPII
jgi:hypothetical protein